MPRPSPKQFHLAHLAECGLLVAVESGLPREPVDKEDGPARERWGPYCKRAFGVDSSEVSVLQWVSYIGPSTRVSSLTRDGGSELLADLFKEQQARVRGVEAPKQEALRAQLDDAEKRLQGTRGLNRELRKARDASDEQAAVQFLSDEIDEFLDEEGDGLDEVVVGVLKRCKNAMTEESALQQGLQLFASALGQARKNAKELGERDHALLQQIESFRREQHQLS